MQSSTVIHPSQRAAIQRLLDSGLSFALFRRPNALDVELVLQTTGEARTVDAHETDLHGFIFAPFHETPHRPTLLIRPDVTATGWTAIEAATADLRPAKRLPLSQLSHSRSEMGSVENSNFYKRNFDTLLSQIAQERFEKLVLSYCQEAFSTNHMLDREAVTFLRALDKYPNGMIHLTYTPTSGRWIGCTPEQLLHRDGDKWHTVALAGTHAFGDGVWDTKNVHEQDVVRRFIQETLEGMGATEILQKRSTMQIGQLMHIRTDFEFRFAQRTHTMDVVRSLHPTPAVSGYPQGHAYRYLVQCERSCRNYFSGYLGLVDGNENADLYVNLRCAQICKKATYYHAGGGLTPLSLFWEERQEIERKMQMLKSLL